MAETLEDSVILFAMAAECRLGVPQCYADAVIVLLTKECGWSRR
jgi:hypothetical protein